jgi:hypothetical protein
MASADWQAGFSYEVRRAFPWVRSLETSHGFDGDAVLVKAVDGKKYVYSTRIGLRQGDLRGFGAFLLQTEYNRKVEADTEDWYDF